MDCAFYVCNFTHIHIRIEMYLCTCVCVDMCVYECMCGVYVCICVYTKSPSALKLVPSSTEFNRCALTNIRIYSMSIPFAFVGLEVFMCSAALSAQVLMRMQYRLTHTPPS